MAADLDRPLLGGEEAGVHISSCLIARGNAVLVHARAEGRPGAVPTYSKLLDIIPEHVEKFRMADPDERHCWLGILGQGGIMYVVQAQEGTRVEVVFSFLHRVAEDFASALGERAATALPGTLQRAYAAELQQHMVFYNSNKHVDKFGTVRAKLAHVKELAVENVEKALARGERIQLLVDKSEDLRTSSTVFEKKSKEVRDVFWWRNARVWAMLAGVVLLAALVATGFACKWKFATCF